MSDFSAQFLAAVVDTLLPGLPATATHRPLPAATSIGVDQQLATHLRTHLHRERLAAWLQALVEVADGEENFTAAAPTAQIALIQRLEATNAPAFYAFLLVVTADYYQNATVIQAMGWLVEPPQPQGYPLPAFDETLLAPVKTRAPLWRA
jgi:hypothetical protein